MTYKLLQPFSPRVLSCLVALTVFSALIALSGCDSSGSESEDAFFDIAQTSKQKQKAPALSSDSLDKLTEQMYENEDMKAYLEWLLTFSEVSRIRLQQNTDSATGNNGTENRRFLKEFSKKSPREVSSREADRVLELIGVEDPMALQERTRSMMGKATKKFLKFDKLSQKQKEKVLEKLLNKQQKKRKIKIKSKKPKNKKSKKAKKNSSVGNDTSGLSGSGTPDLEIDNPGSGDPCAPNSRAQCITRANRVFDNTLAKQTALFGMCVAACSVSGLTFGVCAAGPCNAAYTTALAGAEHTRRRSIQKCYASYGGPHCELGNIAGGGGGGSGGSSGGSTGGSDGSPNKGCVTVRNASTGASLGTCCGTTIGIVDCATNKLRVAAISPLVRGEDVWIAGLSPTCAVLPITAI